ncbi:uncharacterized protein LOC108089123 [Drosophila ficusphila]|uniref:uncharacterized protein LOC108089123 n=1 Tax=Drosophila ficusphila TaxID=30025 RepID=UPI001C898403|nr:uncharacterized protein LOC108089123 [Drosophila ficusphila]
MFGKKMKFLPIIDNVRWYRGMSNVQTKACEGLLHALRDDMEQGSAYRVRRCISQLGLYPLVGTSQIKILMSMSRGSDLAFLWFLWELAYKNPEKCRNSFEVTEPGFYTVNEQLLLSGIAHLDMPATLRALDELLPPGTQSEKKRNSPSQSCTKKRCFKPNQSSGKDNILPYFERLVRPRPFIANQMYRPPESKLRFPEFSKYRDHLHPIPNENSRWFASYEFCPVKRIITKLLSKQLDSLLLEPKKNDTKENDILCKTHRFRNKTEFIEQQEMKYWAIQHCLDLMDVPGGAEKVRRKRILEDIECDVERAANKTRRAMRKPFSEVKNNLSNKKVSPARQSKRIKDDLCRVLGPEVDSTRVHLHSPPKDDLTHVILMQSNKSNRCGAGDCIVMDVNCSLEDKKDIIIKPKEPSIHEEEIHLRPSTFQNLADLIPVCSRTLRLKSPSTKHPDLESFATRKLNGIQFDYQKIYDVPTVPIQPLPWEDDNLDLKDKQSLIKNLCIQALENGKSNSIKDFQLHKNLPPILKTAANCAIDIFRSKIEEVNEIPPEKIQDLIDPNDTEQIENLLKEAFRILRKNPNYVLASLSNSHKLPVLLDWVANRYGKTFNRKEMQILANTSFRTYETIYQKENQGKEELLKVKGNVAFLGSSTYAHYKKFMCEARRIKTKYHKKLNDSALEQARKTWLALRGYSHLGGPIKDTFFAYMPAKQQDLKRHRIWKSFEYRDMVQLRLRKLP